MAPKFLRSDAWLSAVTAGIIGQLGWIFPAWNGSFSPDDTKWRWQDQTEMELFASQVAMLSPALLAPFPSKAPRVRVLGCDAPSVLASNCTRALEGLCAADRTTGTEAECEACVIAASSSDNVVSNCSGSGHFSSQLLAYCGAVTSTPIRARAWALPPSNSSSSGNHSSSCTYVVVVNTDEERFIRFKLQVGDGASAPLPPATAATTAVRLFEAGYSVLVAANGTLADSIAPGSVNIYGLGGGCARLT